CDHADGRPPDGPRLGRRLRLLLHRPPLRPDHPALALPDALPILATTSGDGACRVEPPRAGTGTDNVVVAPGPGATTTLSVPVPARGGSTRQAPSPEVVARIGRASGRARAGWSGRSGGRCRRRRRRRPRRGPSGGRPSAWSQ